MVSNGKKLRAEVDRHLNSLDDLDELSDERYHATHERFEAASNQRSLILEWIERLAATTLRPGSGPIEMLSVGCGGGVMDRQIADRIAASGNAVHITGVDPNAQHIPAFKETFDGTAHRVDTFQGSFDEFHSNGRFDLVYFLHSLYYFESIEPALRAALGRLKPGGSLIVFQAPNAELNHLADRVWRKQFDQAAWYSGDVRRLLDSMEGPTTWERLDARVDVTPCFESDDPAGVELLDFVVQADTRRFSPAFRASLRDSLRAICTSSNGRLLAPHPVDVLTIRAD